VRVLKFPFTVDAADADLLVLLDVDDEVQLVLLDVDGDSAD